MAELLGKDEQLAVWNFEILRRRRGSGCRLAVHQLRAASQHFDANRDAVFHFELADGDRTVGNIEHAFDEAALGVARAIGKLRHRMEKCAKASATDWPRPIRQLGK